MYWPSARQAARLFADGILKIRFPPGNSGTSRGARMSVLKLIGNLLALGVGVAVGAQAGARVGSELVPASAAAPICQAIWTSRCAFAIEVPAKRWIRLGSLRGWMYWR